MGGRWEEEAPEELNKLLRRTVIGLCLDLWFGV